MWWILTVVVVLVVFVGLLILSIPLAWVLGILKMFKVNEGTGTAFKFLGEYRYSVMSLKGHHLGQDEFIMSGDGSGDESSSAGGCWCIWRIGGWVFYIKWLVEPTKYNDQNNADGFGEKYNVFLNQIQRDFTLEKAETYKGEEIPLNLKAAFKMKVVNIYLFLFIAPKDVIAKVIEIIEAIHRAWIKSHKYEKIQEVSSNGGKMWDQFGADIKASIKKIKDDWGIEILEESISIMDVGLQEEDQKAFAEKKRQKLRTASGAQELLGGMLENEAFSMGLENGDEAQKELTKTPEGKKKLEAMVVKANLVVTQRALGVKPNLFGNADGSSLDPITATFATLISLAKGTNSVGKPGESSTENPSEKKGKKGGKRTAEDFEPEELEEEMKRIGKEVEARKKKP